MKASNLVLLSSRWVLLTFEETHNVKHAGVFEVGIVREWEAGKTFWREVSLRVLDRIQNQRNCLVVDRCMLKREKSLFAFDIVQNSDLRLLMSLWAHFEICFTDLDFDLTILKSIDSISVLGRAVCMYRRMVRCKRSARASSRLTANCSNLGCS